LIVIILNIIQIYIKILPFLIEIFDFFAKIKAMVSILVKKVTVMEVLALVIVIKTPENYLNLLKTSIQNIELEKQMFH